MLIKSMPRNERPLEKAMRNGVKSLSNSELLGIMLHTGTRNISSIQLVKRSVIQSSHDIAELFMEELRYEKKEHFKSVMMNTKGEVISVETVSIGTLSNTVVHPREVFGSAVKKSAAGVIFVHNHPSGDPKPSEEDILTTERLKKGGEILGIEVLDHIIIGNGKFSSLKAMELL